jgi:hypothetical protein
MRYYTCRLLKCAQDGDTKLLCGSAKRETDEVTLSKQESISCSPIWVYEVAVSEAEKTGLTHMRPGQDGYVKPGGPTTAMP